MVNVYIIHIDHFGFISLPMLVRSARIVRAARLPLRYLHPQCQHAQFNALVERGSCDGAEVVAKGLAPCGGAADGALVFARGVRGCAREVGADKLSVTAPCWFPLNEPPA